MMATRSGPADVRPDAWAGSTRWEVQREIGGGGEAASDMTWRGVLAPAKIGREG